MPRALVTPRYLLPVAVAWVVFHLVAAGSGLIGSHVLRSVHLCGAIVLTVLFQPLRPALRAVDWAIIATAVTAGGYLVVHSDAILMSNWFINPAVEKALSGALFLALMECIRRALGWVFVGLVLVFLAYAVLGPYIPGVLGHRGLTADRLLFSFYLGAQGVTGMLVGISASVVALFLIFGELLNTSGAGQTFLNIALRIGGRLRGGAGMVAVIGSAFMGMINGSAVANVASTGVLTIPLMRRLGFSRNLSGAIESVASTGGQFMPPIMGPGAFLMAELLGISYLDVATAALIPSTLFYIGLLFAVWLFAGKNGLQPIPSEMIPERRVAYAPRAVLVLIVPIGVLVGLVIARFTVQYAVLWAIVLALLLFVIGQLSTLREAGGMRRALAETGRGIGMMSDQAARNVAYVGMIIAAAQLVVAIINLTGLGVTLSQIIVTLGRDMLVLSLILTMVVAIMLGMGMPTPAAYAVAAAVLGPPLGRLGLELIEAHLFIYYFACLAAITPPVAAAVFAATAISRGRVLPTAGFAILLSLSLYLVPYLFVQDPVLLMQGSIGSIAVAFVTGAAGVGLLTVVTVGYFEAAVPLAVRGACLLAALALLLPDTLTDVIGAVVFAGLLALHLRARQSAGARP
ncbi:TRAP transporter permease [Roseovarius salinarum]|uniref:TRAP transporter permease n=1 Tax=Roseovarius salinarum TaxID=1981892 RepID=UPI001300118C|nr:TRAP transporter fused permease subunit [Roseovarius salinarum]